MGDTATLTKPDFSGWATKAGLKCTDGRTIMPEAFKHQDKVTVPLVWQHGHNTIDNILGHAVLEARDEGVYTYGFFNDSPQGKNAKIAVSHGDINSLSIWANKLVEKSKQVFHGMIHEVSLVLSGANPGAMIDFVAIQHSDGEVTESSDEAVIYTGLTLEHSDKNDEVVQHEGADADDVYDAMSEAQKQVVVRMIAAALADGEEAGGDTGPNTLDTYEAMSDAQKAAVARILGASLDAIPDADDPAGVQHADSGGQTVQDVYNSLNDVQKQVVHYMIGAALEAADEANNTAAQSDSDTNNLSHQDQEGTQKMNVFEGSATAVKGPKLTHAQLETITADAKKMGSLKEALLAHAVEYGIEDIDLLFPNATNISGSPQLVSRRMEWVSKVLDGISKSPFSRIKTYAADVTHDEARAKGYVKGNLKKEEWFTLSRRITTPTTIYKKQALDRDDIVDITDLDIVAFLKGEMRIMLDEEIARAIMVGDGRAFEDPDKVDESCIRPIAHDDDFYAHKVILPTNVGGDGLVEAMLRARIVYRGSGTPTLYLSEGMLADLLLGKDRMGRRYYNSIQELQVALRVQDIVPVNLLDAVLVDSGELLAIMVNLTDYTAGATAGGQVAMFDDFDIDYNQYKYLMETRMSGALTRFKSALVFSRAAGTLVNPTVPTFNAVTGVLTIPNQAGVIYYNRDTDQALSAGDQTALVAGGMFTVLAQPDEGHYFPSNVVESWTYTRNNG